MRQDGAVIGGAHSSEAEMVGELHQRLSPEAVIRRNEPLARHTTMRVGGAADLYVEPASEADLAALLAYCNQHRQSFFILGRGSNLLVRDKGFRGAAICLSNRHFSRVEVVSERLNCGAGANLRAVAAEARRNALTGLEFLEGIPGSVGGALRMNAGAMGSALFDVVESVRLMSFEGQVCDQGAHTLKVEYRKCPSLKMGIAVSAVLRGHLGTREVIEQRMNGYRRKRWQSQPAAPSAGCIFKNPGSIPAGRLIDELGLKETRVGGAVVSAEHANFIVNDGSATARDILRLIEIIQERARAERGIELETEVEVIGE